ncbi:MAG: c-type cytochrome [Ginsengibacter sp.]
MNTKRFSIQFLNIISIAVLLLTVQNSIKAQTKPWTVPESATKVKNPVARNAASIRKGSALFISNCAPCHGKTGKGDGPASASVDPRPADLTTGWKPEDTDGALYYMISTGHTPMPKFKVALNKRQRWELVNYIRTLPQKNKNN